jgi:hypothetical protein
MLKNIYNFRRAIFYSTIINLGLLFLINIQNENQSLFGLAAIVIYFVILFEMCYIWFISKEKLKQFDLPLITTYTKLKEFLHHLMLPSLLYAVIVGFIYFNNQAALTIPLITTSFFAFAALFVNLRAYYQDKLRLEKDTYFVYDLIELLLFFGAVNVFLHLFERYEYNIGLIVGAVSLGSFLLLIINLYQFEYLRFNSILVVLVMSILVGIVAFLLINFTSFNLLSINTLIFLFYYFLFGILSHKVDGSLEISVIIEYVSIFLLSLAFLFGIS